MPSNRRAELARALRFAAVGILNTALGYSLILTALALGCSDVLANALGYAGGLVLGFVLNSRWTFSGPHRSSKGTLLRYVASFVFAYAANLTVVISAVSMGYETNPFVHLAGICLYSVLFYIASSRFVFVDEPRNAKDALS